jgi:serine-type D-Ala-D-Ala carboxypeptidase (penicillin-binding protein 5/6)
MLFMTKVIMTLILFCPLAHASSTPPPPPTLKASASLLIDAKSGQILAQHNAKGRIEPASTTKLMTLYVINKKIKNGSLSYNDKVLISKAAWEKGGSKMFINAGDLVSVDDLLRGMIVSSGNDATIALAEHIAGSEENFSTLMNHYAQELGLKDSHFSNPTGWPDPALYTSAEDLALLARTLLEESDEKLFSYYTAKSFTYQNIYQENRNRLLWQGNGITGLKTGYSEKAGYCIVASAQRQGMSLIAVVMGTDSEKARTEETQKYLSYGFQFFESHKLYDADTTLEKAPLWMGKEKTIPVGIKHPIYVTIPRGQYQKIQALIALKKPLTAPISPETPLGTLRVRFNEKVIVEEPLLSLDTIEKGGFWSCTKDYIQLQLTQWWSS